MEGIGKTYPRFPPKVEALDQNERRSATQQADF
jgi:hypothetical protein